MNVIKFFFAFYIILALIVIMLEYDHENGDDRIYNYFVYSKDCDFNIRNTEYYLGKLDGRYVVCKDVYGIKCLTGFQVAGIDCIYPEIKPPATFEDSCSAKGYLVAYLKQQDKIHVEKNITRVK